MTLSLIHIYAQGGDEGDEDPGWDGDGAEGGGDEIGKDEESKDMVALAKVAGWDGSKDEDEGDAEEPELVAGKRWA